MSDIGVPCAICGEAAILEPKDMHHTVPRGRGGHDSPLAPVCRRCHDLCEPQGSWRVMRQDTLWMTLDVATGEEICRRPVEPRGVEVLAQVQHTADFLDPRANKCDLLTFLKHLSDSDLEVLDKIGAFQHQNGARVRALCRYEAYERWPFKEAPNWAEQIAKGFGVAENTVYQDVAAARVYVADTGPAKDWSWYREAARWVNRLGLDTVLRAMNEVWEQGGKVRDFRREVGGGDEEPETCECAACGNKHVKSP